MSSEANLSYIGVDAGKAQLVCSTPDQLIKVPNARAEVNARLAEWKNRYPKLHLIIEPSGGQERVLLAAAAAHHIPVTRVNARQVREFARGMGWLEKSDTIDSKALQKYGMLAQPRPTEHKPEVEVKLRELVQMRDHYVERLKQEQVYAQTLQTKAAAKIAQAAIEQLNTKVQQVEQAMEELIETEAPEMQLRIQTLCLVKGLADRSAISLLAYVPELGRLTDRAVSKLVGVAPIVDDSGERAGNRHIAHGRAQARRILYMCACVAAQRNEYLSPYYKRLIAAGKEPKVALIAVARKLLCHLNRLLKPLYFEPV